MPVLLGGRHRHSCPGLGSREYADGCPYAGARPYSYVDACPYADGCSYADQGSGRHFAAFVHRHGSLYVNLG